jgi:ribosomal protein S5
VEAAGIHDLLTKSFGSTNKVNNAYATIMALSQLKPIESNPQPKSSRAKTAKSDTKVAKAKAAV